MRKLKKSNFNTYLSIVLFIIFVSFSFGFSSISSTNSIYTQFSLQPSFIENDSSLIFSEEELNRATEKLNKKLIKLSEIKVIIGLNIEKIRLDFEKLKESSIFNSKEIKKIVENLNREFEEHPLDIDEFFDFDELNECLQELEEKTEDMKIDMSNIKVEMKKLKLFLKEMKTELIKDGYVKNEDEDYDLEFTEDYIFVNGKKMTDILLEKYKELYENHFDREIDDEFRMKK
ncbi:MAG: hypothetical protein IH949_00765 [Bacteroidetes bacterium]|nr:hypothetical protein [Bacteroidota bacterium]